MIKNILGFRSNIKIHSNDMANKTKFQANSCFWYYITLSIVLIILEWTVVLITYNDTTSDKSELDWPSNLNMWDYFVNSLVIYIIWTATVLLFMWGAYHADCRDIPGERVEIYRSLFLIIVILNLLSLFLFFVQHNIKATLIAQILILILVIGLIFLYTEIDIHDAWYTFPYMLITVYFIYGFWYALRMNTGHPDINNTLFEI